MVRLYTYLHFRKPLYRYLFFASVQQKYENTFRCPETLQRKILDQKWSHLWVLLNLGTPKSLAVPLLKIIRPLQWIDEKREHF